jgi:hypothetical protein
VGRSKAQSAAAAVKSMLQSKMRVLPVNAKLERSTEHIVTPAVWGQVDVVMMALVSECCVCDE